MTTGLDIAALRGGAVLAPAALAAALWLVSPTARVRGAAVLATLWNAVALLAVNAVAVAAGWWTFGTTGSMWAGVPVDVVVGWALLWGAVPVLIAAWVSPPVTAAVLVAGDLLAMPRLAPLVVVHPHWWWGETGAVVLALLPGIVLGRLTVTGEAVRLRAGLQVVLFGAVLLFVIPTVVFSVAGTGWAAVLRTVGGPVDLLLLQVGAAAALIAIRAVAEFARHGGTPFPWDPPRRLVRSGPYAYLANPMQVCAVTLLTVAAAVLGRPLLLAAAAIAVVFSAGLAGWSEREHLRDRFGADWVAYRRQVRDWMPRRRPAAQRPDAVLYVAADCDPCRDVGDWFARRGPTALRIVDAADHPEPLRRIRYESVDGVTASGVGAVAAALEHLSLGYAVMGWLLATPGVAGFVQLLVDATGGGPRVADGRG